MSKPAYKIKKKKTLSTEQVVVRTVVITVAVITFLIAVALTVFEIKPFGGSPDANAEIQFINSGSWETIGIDDIKVWLPDNVGSIEKFNNRSITRVEHDDQGNLLTAYGSIVIEDVEDVQFDLENDAFTLMDICRSDLLEVLEDLVGGVPSSISYDLSPVSLVNKTDAVEGFGEFEVRRLYKYADESDDATHTEYVKGDLYLMLVLHDEKPMVCWGLSTLMSLVGEQECMSIVTDMAVSVSNFKNKIQLLPNHDYLEETSTVIEEGEHYDMFVYTEYAPGKYINYSGDKVEELPETSTVYPLEGEPYKITMSGEKVTLDGDVIEEAPVHDHSLHEESPNGYWDEDLQEFVNQ